MKFSRESFEESFVLANVPKWHCPSCWHGLLLLKQEDVVVRETGESMKQRDDPDWEAEWLRERFYGSFKCSNPKCAESIVIAGQARPQPDYWEDEATQQTHLSFTTFFYPEYFSPTLKLFELPEALPFELEEPLDKVFKLFWVDKEACVNAIRKTVEVLLDAQKVQKTSKTKAGKREYWKLHQRIEKFQQQNPEVASMLMAVKWLGNHGSHAGELEHEDLLDSVELLSFCIYKLYTKDEKRIITISRKINKRKGPIN